MKYIVETNKGHKEAPWREDSRFYRLFDAFNQAKVISKLRGPYASVSAADSFDKRLVIVFYNGRKVPTNITVQINAQRKEA